MCVVPSDENQENASFPSPRSGSTHKQRRSLPEYPKRTWCDAVSSPEIATPTLRARVLATFPDTNPKKLENWIHRVEGETAAEPELLLFTILLCGVQFRINHPEVRVVLGELWTWLTQHPQNMNSELAELVIEVIGPGLAQAVDRRGWQRGIPAGPC